MDLILFLKLARDDTLRIGIGIELQSLGDVNKYDISNKEERDLGTANVPFITCSFWSKQIFSAAMKVLQYQFICLFLLIFKG